MSDHVLFPFSVLPVLLYCWQYLPLHLFTDIVEEVPELDEGALGELLLLVLLL